MEHLKIFESIPLYDGFYSSKVCILLITTPIGKSVGFYQNNNSKFYCGLYLISTDNLKTLDFSKFNTVVVEDLQEIIDTWEEGSIAFNSSVATYLKGMLVLGNRAHWEDNVLIAGGGHYYEPEFNGLRVWYDDGTVIDYDVSVIDVNTIQNGDKVIEAVIGDKVTSIGSSAFSGCSGMRSVNIPSGVTSIGISAFYGCNGLAKAEFASIESLCKIKFGSYSANPLWYAKHLYINGQEVTDVVIPNSVTSIGNYTFDGCSGLTSITIPNSVTSIGDYAFYYCSSLTSVTIPNSVICFGEGIFEGCNSLQSITSDGLRVKLDVTSSEQQFDKYSIQSVIDTIQEGGVIEFSHESALYLKGELVLGDKAHWDGDTLMYGPNGSGYYYDYSYDYQEDGDNIDDTDDGQPVDLGLPSGTLWSKCNLGAEKETDFGLYYQWGDTQGYEGVDKHQFNWDDYKYGSSDKLSKYNENDDKLILDNEDDPVFVATNGMFKMPTQEQLQELIGHTNHEWIENFKASGVNGMKFTNKKDTTKYIFIPAAGSCYYGNHNGVGSWGYVWSASLNESLAYYAWYMFCNAGSVDTGSSYRCVGCSVRGVVVKNT